MRVWGKPQQPKPFHDERLGPPNGEALSWPCEASGEGQPVHPQFLYVAVQPALGQGPSQGVHHGHERVAVHHT
jgi:hypothetical protein